MILDKKVLIKTNSANMKFLTERGYGDLKKGIDLEVKIEDLSKGSHAIINVKCDYCEKERTIVYRKYLSSFNINGKYACSRKCCIEKKILTTQERYNVDNVFQLESVKEQSRKTCIEKYGKEWFTQTEYYIESLMRNYGVVNVFQMESTKTTIYNTFIDNYGCYPSQTEKYKEKMKMIFLDLLGVDHPMKHPDVIKKSNDTKTAKGNRIPDEDLNEYKLYIRNVINETNKVVKELLKNWDGYDYYDGEYIKDYYNLHVHDDRYPHIDHKISKFYGFKNGLTVKEIADINNLCITKRIINISKGKKCDNEI